MAFIGIQIPIEIAKDLTKIKVPGKKTPIEKMHVTMFYLGETVSASKIAETLVVLNNCLKSAEPFKIKFKEVTCFPEGEDGFPIIVKVESEDLLKLREKIKKSFDKNKIKYSNRFPEYKPHITLSYSKKEIEPFDIKSNTHTIDEIILWGGSTEDDGIDIKISLKKKAQNINMLTELFFKLAKYTSR